MSDGVGVAPGLLLTSETEVLISGAAYAGWDLSRVCFNKCKEIAWHSRARINPIFTDENWLRRGGRFFGSRASSLHRFIYLRCRCKLCARGIKYEIRRVGLFDLLAVFVKERGLPKVTLLVAVPTGAVPLKIWYSWVPLEPATGTDLRGDHELRNQVILS